jgi:hypothetical protein
VDSVEGITENSGACVGDEKAELSGAGVGPRSGVTEEEAGGSAEGDDAGGAAADARVSIWTFIPWLQCPIVPQMKFLVPGEESGMVVVPPL